MSAPIAIGVGCRKGCRAETIEELIRRALDDIPIGAPLGLFTIADKSGEAGLAEAADHLGLDLVFLSPEVLRENAALVRTRSVAAERRFGVPSVAEAAALAGAGPGSVLIVARLSNGGATCAVAGQREGSP